MIVVCFCFLFAVAVLGGFFGGGGRWGGIVFCFCLFGLLNCLILKSHTKQLKGNGMKWMLIIKCLGIIYILKFPEKLFPPFSFPNIILPDVLNLYFEQHWLVNYYWIYRYFDSVFKFKSNFECEIIHVELLIGMN